MSRVASKGDGLLWLFISSALWVTHAFLKHNEKISFSWRSLWWRGRTARCGYLSTRTTHLVGKIAGLASHHFFTRKVDGHEMEKSGKCFKCNVPIDMVEMNR